MRILFVDTETGGLDPTSFSLLSIGLVVWSDGEIVAKKEIFIDDENLRVSPEALKTTNINMVQHLQKAVPPQKAIEQMLDFCYDYMWTPQPWTIAGHNTHFDVSFLKLLFKNHGWEWGRCFSHRVIDTFSILKLLQISGLIECVDSSDKAFEYFKIDVKGRHTALGDAEATASLFTKLVKLVNPNMQFT